MENLGLVWSFRFVTMNDPKVTVNYNLYTLDGKQLDQSKLTNLVDSGSV